MRPCLRSPAGLMLGVAVAALTACRGDSRRQDAPAPDRQAPAASTTPASLFRDSAAADSQALAMLPAARQPDFDVLGLLSATALSDSSRAYCQPFADTTDGDVRRRLRSSWPEPWITVLFVRADRATGSLRRVEMVRRRRNGPQQGYIWDAERNETRAIEWSAGGQQEYTVPEGTPVPARFVDLADACWSRRATVSRTANSGGRRASCPGTTQAIYRRCHPARTATCPLAHTR